MTGAGDGPPARVGLVGSGFRAQAFLALAARLPELFEVTGVVTRGAASGTRVETTWGVPSHRGVGELVRAGRPEVVVTAVTGHANPALVTALVDLGVTVLSETPPAPDATGLHELWRRVGDSGLVHVAEQYPSSPQTAARLRLLADGAVGPVTSAQVSATHGHHGVALLRALLGVGSEAVEVRAVTTTSRLLDPLDRGGWTDDDEPGRAGTTVATLEVEGGAVGLHEYTDNQMRNPLRAARTVVRGERGELVDDVLTRLVGPRTIVRSTLVRQLTGQDLDMREPDLEHVSCDGRVLYRNPLPGRRLSDEELAQAAVLAGAVAAARGEPDAGYGLAQGCQDALLGYAITEAASTRHPVLVPRPAWA